MYTNIHDNPIIHRLDHAVSRVPHSAAFKYTLNDQYTTLTYAQLYDVVDKLADFYTAKCDIKLYQVRKGVCAALVRVHA